MVDVSGGNGTDNVVGARYRLLRRLGQQASTELWEAFDVRLERPVALRLLAPNSRTNRGAQDRLHRAARQRQVDDAPGAPRVLDGGDDPTYGPFVVAELSGGLQATQPLTLEYLPPAPADTQPAHAQPAHASPAPAAEPLAPADEPRALVRPRRAVAPGHAWGGFGVLALLGLVLVVLGAVVFLAGAFAPSKALVDTTAAGPAPGQATRPLSGAPAGQPAATPTLVPTLAAPTPGPLAPAAQPKVQPTPPPAAPTRGPGAAPTPAVPTASTPAAPTTDPTPPAAPTTRQPAPTPALAAAVQVAAGSPVATIREHYALIDARRFADGYTLMDAHLRSLNSPTDYAGWFANKVSIKPISVDLISQTDSQAVVRSVVETTDRLNGQNVTSQVAEQFVLRNEDGAWHIAQVSRV